MKNINQIETEIKELLELYKGMPDGLDAKAEKKLSMLRKCKYYLETNPSEGFCKIQEAGLERRINFHEDHVLKIKSDYYKGEDAIKKEVSEYKKEVELQLLKSQLKVIKYILE